MPDNSLNEEQEAGTSKRHHCSRSEHSVRTGHSSESGTNSESGSGLSKKRSRDMTRGFDVMKLSPQAKIRKRGQLEGRVTKRKSRPLTKRRRAPAPKRKIKPRQVKSLKDASLSTIISQASTSEPPEGKVCKRCGHRCCMRRYKEYRRELKSYLSLKEEQYLRRQRRRPKRRRARQNIIRKRQSLPQQATTIKKEVRAVQTGSRCKCLSPLCINAYNCELTSKENLPDDPDHCEITPEMIFDTVEQCTKWSQYVDFETIIYHLKMNYAVNSDDKELEEELTDKLEVAVLVGILTRAVNCRTKQTLYCLSSPLFNTRLTDNHVSLFWTLYLDTMNPLYVNREPEVKQEAEAATQTQHGGKRLLIKTKSPQLQIRDQESI